MTLPTLRLAARLLAALAPLLAAPAALASTCYAFVEGVPGIRYAALGPVASLSPEVRILYVGHSTFRIETPEGISINTDYFGANGPGGVPTVVTMNRAHETHYTDFPDPEIRHVLRGWDPSFEGKAEHDLEVGDVRIRNVTTDIRGYGSSILGKDGNSIFVFEVGGICIGHLGHLHHVPTEEQFAALGRMDVLMVPVDGSFTMSVGNMIEVATRLKSSYVLPMHFFGRTTLQRFMAGMAEEFRVETTARDELVVSLETLPSEPTVVLLEPTQWRRPGPD